MTRVILVHSDGDDSARRTHTHFLGELDFSVLESVDQFTAVIGRDFEAKAPTGTDILARVKAGTYPGRFELLRDLGQNLFWVNRGPRVIGPHHGSRELLAARIALT